MNDIITLSPPKQMDSTYLLADYVEILCLINQDGEITIDEAVSRVYKSAEYEACHEAESLDDSDHDTYSGELNDHQLARGEDWFRHLSYRQNAFDGFYPFCLDDDTLKLKCDLSISQALYVFLLICSKLSILNRSKRNQLTTKFENISHSAFGSFLPSFTIHHFGKTPDGRDLYPNKLKDALYKLCEYINETPVFDPDDFPDNDTGDGGLDLIAFKLFGDNISSNMICLAQCACGPDAWMGKQNDSSYNNWRKRINFVHPTANYMFTPVCFRRDDGKWFKRDKIVDSILFDRLRICRVLEDSLVDNIDLYESVQTFLDFEE